MGKRCRRKKRDAVPATVKDENRGVPRVATWSETVKGRRSRSSQEEERATFTREQKGKGTP